MARTRDYASEYRRRKSSRIIREREARLGRELAPEYKRRVKRAIEKGKTLQQARGHRPGEARERRERETAEHGLSSAQMRSIENWANRYKNEDRDVEEIIDFAKSEGYAWFVQYRETWNAARKQYLKELASGKYASRGLGYLQMLADEASAPQISWLYYH